MCIRDSPNTTPLGTTNNTTPTTVGKLELTGIAQDPFGTHPRRTRRRTTHQPQRLGISWNTNLDAEGVMISDKISLEFELSLAKDHN